MLKAIQQRRLGLKPWDHVAGGGPWVWSTAAFQLSGISYPTRRSSTGLLSPRTGRRDDAPGPPVTRRLGREDGVFGAKRIEGIAGASFVLTLACPKR